MTENLLSATTTFGPQRGSLFATFPPRTTRYFIIIRETPRNELLTKKPAITLYQQSNQSAGGNNLYFPVFDLHYVISMVSYRPKSSTNQRARNRSGIVKIINYCNVEVKGIIGIRWGKENFDPFYLPLLRVSLPWSSELTIFDIIALSTGDPAPPNIPTMGPDRIKKMYSIPCTNVLPQILYYEENKHVWRGGLFDEKGIYLIFCETARYIAYFFGLSCNSLRAVSLLLGNLWASESYCYMGM